MKKSCTQCSQQFEITDDDMKFYHKMDVPPPTLCPTDRMKRRISYRNERALYHRKCDLTGKQIIASASKDKPYPVYDIEAWWSDDWNPMHYGREFDFNRTFFEQWEELRDQVPRLALQHQKPMQNSDYCNCASHNKDCYLIFSTNYCEDCYYGSWINYCRDCIDNETCLESELCYETIDCKGCYNVIYAEECRGCSNSAFIKDCNSCKNCLFCTNLNNKEFHINNLPVSKDEYETFKSGLELNSFHGLSSAKNKFEELKKGMKVKYYYGTQNENVSGNYINNCQNSLAVYECDVCQDIKYCNNVMNAKDCMDYSYWGQNSELIYECQASGYDLHNLRFCNLCWSNCNNLTLCDHCFSIQNCFGCVGMKKGKFCILNRQYTEEEYNKLVPAIIEHMKKTGEWGENFPIEMSPFAYNETLANEWFPLTKEQAHGLSYKWQDKDESNEYVGAFAKVSDKIDDVSDEITKQILKCEVTGKLYKILPQELNYYRKTGLPVPRRCPDQRHADRMKRRNPRHLYTRSCIKCSVPIETTFAPDRPEKVYCEPCYLKEVY